MFALICFVMALTSTTESGDKFIYPKGLPCKVHNTTQLDCSYRELTRIPPLNVYDHHVKSLDLSHNQLSTVNGTSFVNLNSLEELNLSWNNIWKVTFNVTLPLRVLNLSFQFLSYRKELEIMAGAFSGLQKLEKLDLAGNSVKEIWVGNRPKLRFFGSPFHTTPSLKSLYLSGNEISGLNSLVFNGLKHLQLLEMYYVTNSNDFKFSFQDLHELKKLGMNIMRSGSDICLPIPILKGLHNLHELNLSGYKSYRHLQLTLFDGLISLKYLDLSKSGKIIRSLGFDDQAPFFPPTLFKGLINLEYLDLSSGIKRILPPTLFNNLLSLKYLDLSNCDLHSLPEMKNLTSLKYLDISRNNLYSIQCQVLEALYSLSTLIVSLKTCVIDMNVQCNLQVLNVTTLSHLTITTSFCKLDRECDPAVTWNSYNSFDSTYIQYVPPRIYRKNISDVAGFQDFVRWNSHIKYLHIKNDIYYSSPWLSSELTFMISIDNDVFAIFPYLINLTISGFYDFDEKYAWILIISTHAFRGLPHLRTLSFNDNNLSRVPWDSLEELSHQLKHLDLNRNKITNTSWRGNKTQLHLKTLDLSNNPISILDLSLFGNNTLNKVYLQQINPKDCFNLSTNPSLTSLFVSAATRKNLYINGLCLNSPQLQNLSIVNFAFNIPAIFGPSCESLSLLYVSNSELLYEGNETKLLSFPRLEKLTITECNTVSITRMFHEVPTLRYLDLSKNNITYIKKYQFRFMKNLKHLNLSGNMLTNLQLPKILLTLQILDISMNKLTTVPSMLLKEPWHLQHLYVGNNSFQCTCEVQSLQSFVLSDKITYIDPYLPVMCESVYGRKIGFNEFDLDCSRHLEIYVSVGVASLVFICIIIGVGTLTYKYRWLIRYKLFVLLYQRRYRRYIDNDDDADIINVDEEHNVDGEELAMRRRYNAYVAYHPDNEDWVDEQLIPNLEEGPEQFRLCLKARDLPANRRIFDLVCHGIYHSRKTIAVLSEQFMDDGLCDYQLHVARMRLTKDNDDVLILVQLGEIPDDKMTLLLRQILCHKKVMKWPDDPVGHDLFWGNLRVKLRKPTRVDRRYENV